jgi:type III restriction enzyme
MLTEGWDVPNVFQVVPWESRAFNSKLLIAQVLGRGLRIPAGLEPPLLLTVANHERWTADLANLFKEVLEIENRVHSLPTRPQYSFPLFNLDYVSEIVTEQTQTQQVREPEAVRYSVQRRQQEHVATYSRSGEHRVRVDVPDNMPMNHAVTRMWAYLGEKDARIAAAWPKSRLREFIVGNLQRDGHPDDFLSRENLIKTQNAFGPMFRLPGATVARQKLRPTDLRRLDPMAMPAQSVSEDQLRNNSVVYYTGDAEAGFREPQDSALWAEWVENHQLASRRDIDGIAHFKEALQPQEAPKFKCPSNLLIARYEPERLFIRELIAHAELFDGFLKNADSGFYGFPYSYKSAVRATSHARTESFNPDFILKIAGRDVVLVVEIKSDDDDSARNKAKLRDAAEHFAKLNEKLAAAGEAWKYYFYFLSSVDYGAFFEAVRDGRLGFKSSLMNQLSDG